MRTIFLSALCIFFLSSLEVHADVYRWQDKNGSWHFTDRLDKVPLEYKDQVKSEVLPEQPKEALPPIPQATAVEDSRKKDEPKEESENSESEAGPKTYKIEYTDTEYILKLDVTINGNHTFPLLLDTGATFVSLSKEVGEELGYHRDDILPRLFISTANGVITCSLVRLDSVQVGDAIVHDVTAIVCGNDEDEVEQAEEDESGEEYIVTKGALGLSFLNEFDWSNDTMEEVLILREFTNKPKDDVYGGHNEKWWRKKFEAVKKEIKETEDQIQEKSSMPIWIFTGKTWPSSTGRQTVTRFRDTGVEEALNLFNAELLTPLEIDL